MGASASSGGSGAGSGGQDAARRPVKITRTIEAPRDIVFRMWSDPDLLARWYAPRRCQLEMISFDFRVGGTWRHRIREPDGGGCLCAAVFEEICAPERIVYSLFFTNERGQFIDARSGGADPEWPDRTTVTVTFTERAGTTTMTLEQTVPESLAKRTGAYPSWLEMLDRLCEALPQK